MWNRRGGGWLLCAVGRPGKVLLLTRVLAGMKDEGGGGPPSPQGSLAT